MRVVEPFHCSIFAVVLLSFLHASLTHGRWPEATEPLRGAASGDGQGPVVPLGGAVPARL